MDQRLNRWTNEEMDGPTNAQCTMNNAQLDHNEWMDDQTNEWRNKQTNGRDEQTNGQKNEQRMDKQTNKWRNGWTKQQKYGK